MNDVVEAMARALCQQEGHSPELPYNTGAEPGWTYYTKEAEEILAALKAAGLMVVPVEEDYPQAKIISALEAGLERARPFFEGEYHEGHPARVALQTIDRTARIEVLKTALGVVQRYFGNDHHPDHPCCVFINKAMLTENGGG